MLPYGSVLDEQPVKALARWNGTQWRYPESHLVRVDLDDPLGELIRTGERRRDAIDGVEYRVALASYRLAGYPQMDGEFIGEGRWRDGPLLGETEFRHAASRGGPWPWRKLLGEGKEEVDDLLDAFSNELKKLRRW